MTHDPETVGEIDEIIRLIDQMDGRSLYEAKQKLRNLPAALSALQPDTQEGALKFLADEGQHCDAIEAAVLKERERVDVLTKALEQIRDHRRSCHAYDADVGHELRSFDDQDLLLCEAMATSALKATAIRETPND